MNANLNDNPKIRRDLMLLFEQSVGWQVRLKGQDFRFICRGVDWKMNHVCSDYGNFHVDLCELTGKTESEP